MVKAAQSGKGANAVSTCIRDRYWPTRWRIVREFQMRPILVVEGAPQVGFSPAMRKIKARTSGLTRFLPSTRLAHESHFQYSRKPARCQATTVFGVTSTSGRFQPDQSFRKITQNSLCAVDSRRRGRRLRRASNCCRSAGAPGFREGDPRGSGTGQSSSR
jgi:hypothetical protein